MTDLAYWVHPVEGTQPADHDLVDRALYAASLAHYGHWYRLDLSDTEVTCCTPGPLGPSRVFLWVSPPTGARPLRVKHSPQLTSPVLWRAPAGSVAVQLRAGVRLCEGRHLIVERAQTGSTTGGTYYRVTTWSGAGQPAQLLVEARPR